MNADTRNPTVVNKPKTFWARTTVECMMASDGSAGAEVVGGGSGIGVGWGLGQYLRSTAGTRFRNGGVRCHVGPR